MTTQKKDIIVKSNKSVNQLVNKGYTPQGYDFKKNKVVIFRNDGKIFYFDNYIDANNSLI